jgi:hypothetical protein
MSLRFVIIVLKAVTHNDWDSVDVILCIPARLHLKQYSTPYDHQRHDLNALVHICNVSSITNIVGNKGRHGDTEAFFFGCVLPFQRKFL